MHTHTIDGGQAEVVRRLQALAAEVESRLDGADNAASALRTVVGLISCVTPGMTNPRPDTAPAVPAALADDVIGGSRGLRLLTSVLDACYPSQRFGEQHWVRNSRPGSGWRPGKRSFRSVAGAECVPLAVKPFGYGLFTSTAMSAGYGMWRLYLNEHRSGIFPLPWYTWRLGFPATVKVLTIGDAQAWVSLLSRFPRVHDGQVYPDWGAAASQYDGVQLTFPAVLAAQGVRFLTPSGPSAPGFWDVESTFWLRWRVSSAALVDKTIAT